MVSSNQWKKSPKESNGQFSPPWKQSRIPSGILTITLGTDICDICHCTKNMIFKSIRYISIKYILPQHWIHSQTLLLSGLEWDTPHSCWGRRPSRSWGGGWGGRVSWCWEADSFCLLTEWHSQDSHPLFILRFYYTGSHVCRVFICLRECFYVFIILENICHHYILLSLIFT